MNADATLTFQEQVFRAAGKVQAWAVNQAIDIHIKDGRMEQRHVSDCIELAGRLMEPTSEPKREARPRESATTPTGRRRVARYLEMVTPLVEQTRERLLGSIRPPFSSLRKAVAWIEAQRWKRPTWDRARIQDLERQAMAIGRELFELTGGHSVVKVEQRQETIAYQRPGDRWTHHRPVGGPDTPLGILRAAAHAIHGATDFDEAAVVSHILADVPLRVPGVRYSVGRASGRLPDGTRVVRGRATVTLYTRDVSYETWKQLHRTIRKAWPEREPGLSEAEDRILRLVAAAGGIPAQGKIGFWKRVARKGEGWRTVMMRWRRARKKVMS